MEIKDFGKKIGGAKKDLWRSNGGLTMEDLIDMTSEERKAYVKKDEIWPRPDYTEMIHNGTHRVAAYFQQHLRAAVIPKPAYGTEEDYITAVTEIKKLAETVTQASDIEPFFKSKFVPAFVERYGYSCTLKDFCKGAINNKTFKAAQLTLYKAEKDTYTKHFAMTPEEVADYEAHNMYKLYCYDGKDVVLRKEFNDKLCLAAKRGFCTTFYYTGVSEDIAVNDTYLIIEERKVIAHNLTYDEGMKKVTAMIAAKKTELLDTGASNTGKKNSNRKKKWQSVVVRGISRTGKDYIQELHGTGNEPITEDSDGQFSFTLNGQISFSTESEVHATGEDYIDTFGFYGGEFGNWMSTNDRIASLDYGFNAFKDLADVLGISDKSISFNGGLAIAFGARGQGNASAHYEPMRRVINLTKMSGAGALAHEWGHALDHAAGIFYKVASKSGLASESADACYLISRETKLPDTYKKIDEIISDHNSQYYKDSAEFGNLFTKMGQGYWASSCEMFARAFDCYVTDKLRERGLRSDYLTCKADCFKIEHEGRMIYAYPVGEERKELNKLFDELINNFKKDGMLN